MVIQLRSTGMYKVTMGTEVKPKSAVEKLKFLNRLEEAFGMHCLSILRELLFHVDIIATPSEVWLKIEYLFGKIYEMRSHQLENDLISLIPCHYDTIHDFFTQFKYLVLQLKQCGIDKKEEEVIISILSKLGPYYSMFVRTFHSSKLTT